MVILLIIVLTLRFSGNNKEDGLTDIVENEEGLYSGVHKGEGSWWSTIGKSEDNKGTSEDKETVDLIIPSKRLKGEVINCDIEGSYGKLDITDGGTTKSVELKIGSILFDSEKCKAVYPSDIKKGANLSIYTYEDIEESKLDIDIAEVVLISPSDDMGYTPISNLKVDDKKIEFKTKDTEYVVKGKLYSALTGNEYSDRQIAELEDGDRVIYFGEAKGDKIIIERGYVYPTFE